MKIEPRLPAGVDPPACVPSVLKRPRDRSPVPDRIDNGVSPAAWAAKRSRLGGTVQADPSATKEGKVIQHLQTTLHHLGDSPDIPPDMASLLSFCSNAWAVKAISSQLPGQACEIVERLLVQRRSLTGQESNLLRASLQKALQDSGLFETVD